MSSEKAIRDAFIDGLRELTDLFAHDPQVQVTVDNLVVVAERKNAKAQAPYVFVNSADDINYFDEDACRGMVIDVPLTLVAAWDKRCDPLAANYVAFVDELREPVWRKLDAVIKQQRWLIRGLRNESGVVPVNKTLLKLEIEGREPPKSWQDKYFEPDFVMQALVVSVLVR